MANNFSNKKPSRRQFLAGAAALSAGSAAAGSVSASGDPLITEVQEWAQITGDGVDATPYGLPIEFEKDVVRRNVGWLTADTISSINFTPIHALDGTITPQGCAFERHHSGAIELRKQDYRLMINGLVDQELIFTSTYCTGVISSWCWVRGLFSRLSYLHTRKSVVRGRFVIWPELGNCVGIRVLQLTTKYYNLIFFHSIQISA